jgi:hypothetical protein
VSPLVAVNIQRETVNMRTLVVKVVALKDIRGRTPIIATQNCVADWCWNCVS